MVILDIMAISSGFVLRAVAGAVVLDVEISPWLYVCTSLGALFLGFAKRLNEIDLAGDRGSLQRQSLEEYTPRLLEQLIAIVAPATLVSYVLYTFTAENLPDNNAMLLTIPFVMYGLFRYLYLVHHKNLGESPEQILLTDAPLLVNIVPVAGDGVGSAGGVPVGGAPTTTVIPSVVEESQGGRGQSACRSRRLRDSLGWGV